MIKVALHINYDHVEVAVTYDDGTFSVYVGRASDPEPKDVRQMSDKLIKEVQALVDIHKGVV
jgi:hypothetical protein